MSTELTPAEIQDFLDSQRTLVLVTLRPDGSPVAHPMWFVRMGAAVYVNTRRDSLKAANLSKDPRTCAVIETGESYFELRGVRIEGRGEIVSDSQEIAAVERAQGEKDRRIGSGLGEMPQWFSTSRSERVVRGDRVLLRLPMERVYSWDFSKVREHYAKARRESGGGRS